MPVNRILCCCAVSLPISLNLDYGDDFVYVTVPLVKYARLE